MLSTSNSGTGSLRQAISNANGSAGADTIIFNATVFATGKTITLTSGELSITDAVTISGPAAGVTISGGKTTRIVNASSAQPLTPISFSNITFAAGKVSGGKGGAFSGVDPVLTASSCRFIDNEATMGGAAIYMDTINGGELTLLDCELAGNSSAFGSTINVDGSTSKTILQRTIVSNNLAKGLSIYYGKYVLIENCTLNNNASDFGGAAITVQGDFLPGNLTIRNCTISGNTSMTQGGAIHFADFSSGTMTLQNCTVAFNKAYVGGGIFVAEDDCPLVLESCILSNNVNTFTNPSPEIYSPGVVTWRHSSLASSAGIGTLTNLGNNRPIGENPILMPLADNGGPTKTHALAFSSPVVNKGSNPANLAFDQRGTGNPRNFYGGVDIGAFEVNTIEVDTTVDEFDGDYSKGDLSLREAIALTAFPAVYFDPVVFATPQTITLTMGVFAIPGGRTIIGPAGKVTINANNTGRIFNVTPTGQNAKTNLSNLILTGGNAGTGQGGAIYGQGFGFGGLSVTLNNCTLTGNTATTGGGIAMTSSTLTIEDSTFTNNTANGLGGGGSGGAIAAYFTAMKTFIRRSTISGNTAASGAGGVQIYGGTYQGGISLIEDCTISNNKTAQEGGGLSLGGNANTVRNSTISGNTAGRGGGIVLVAGGTAVIQNSTIVYNTATDVFSAGGGISASVAVPQIFLESSIVSKNSAPSGPDIAAAGAVSAKNCSIFSNAGIASFNDLGGNRPFGEDPLLAPLADNGGPTLTHNLMVGSPVIDKGSNPVPLADDQRGFGFDRLSGPVPDIGALEVIVPALIPAFPESVTLNDYAPQRSRVTHWYITFAGTPTLPMNPADAFQVERQSDGALVQFAVTTIGSDVQLNFTGGPLEFGSLQDGRYTVRIFAAQIPNLDANDDGIVGDDLVLVGDLTNRLFRLFGDENGDGTVAANDFIQFRLSLGGTNPVFDFDGDGAVAASDFIQFRLRFGGSI